MILGIYQMMLPAGTANILDIKQPDMEQGYLKLPLNHKETNTALEIVCNPQNSKLINVTWMWLNCMNPFVIFGLCRGW